MKHWSSIFLRLILVGLFAASCSPAPRLSPTPISPISTPTAAPSAAVPEASATSSSGEVKDPLAFQQSLNAWQPGRPPEYADSTADGAVVSDEQSPLGKQSVALSFHYKEGLKAIFNIEQLLDLSGYESLNIRLADPDGLLASAAVAVSTGDNWTWYEAVEQSLLPGTNTLSFNLKAAGYKTSANGWKPADKISGLEQTRRISLILFPQKEGMVHLLDVNAVTMLTVEQAVQVICPPEPVFLQPAGSLELVLAAGAKPERYAPLEFDLAAPIQPKNPFDPAEANLEVTFTSPSGSTTSLPAFWYQAFDSVGGQPCGAPGWKVRFTPTLPGKWQAQAALPAQDMRSQVLEFQTIDSNRRGFVRVSQVNPRYFAFDNGQTYDPVGINLGWWRKDALSDYARWLDALHENGASTARIWMASWSFGLEWNDTGLGNYTARLRQAWLLDQVFKMAEERGMTLELVLLNHGAFSETTNPEWASNPYYSLNGGPCKSPDCFADDPLARQYFQRRLRYIAARWAYSPSLFAWEWWNEADWTPIQDSAMAVWIKEMTAYLRTVDPYRHLVSTSYATRSPEGVLKLPEIDFTQIHLYDYRDPIQTMPELFRDRMALTPDKPVLFAEFGFSAGMEDTKSYDRDGTHLHNGLWASTFSGFAGPSMYWWWDSYVEPLDLWGQYASLTTFLQGVDLATYAPVKGKVSGLKANALVLQSPRGALAWVKNNAYEATALKGSLKDPLQGLTLMLSGLSDGSYQARWYDPTTHQWLADGQVEVKDGQLILQIPDFSRDLAVKIEKK